MKRPCPVHGSRHQVFDTALCAHHECIGRLVEHNTLKSPSLRRYLATLHDTRTYEEFISYLLERMLRSLRTRNEPPVINPHMLFYALSDFVRRKIDKVAHEHLDTVVDDGFTTDTASPFIQVYLHEVVAIARREKDGDVHTLVALGELVQTEACKALGCSVGPYRRAFYEFRAAVKEAAR